MIFSGETLFEEKGFPDLLRKSGPNPLPKNFNLEKNDRVYFVNTRFFVLFFSIAEIPDEQNACCDDHRKYKDNCEQFEDKSPAGTADNNRRRTVRTADNAKRRIFRKHILYPFLL